MTGQEANLYARQHPRKWVFALIAVIGTIAAWVVVAGLNYMAAFDKASWHAAFVGAAQFIGWAWAAAVVFGCFMWAIWESAR